MAIKKGRDWWQSRGNTHTRSRARLISHSFEIIVADANNSDFPPTKPILAFTIGKYTTAHRKDDQVEYHNDEYHPSDSYLFSRRALTLFSCFYFARSRFFISIRIPSWLGSPRLSNHCLLSNLTQRQDLSDVQVSLNSSTRKSRSTMPIETR